MGCHGGLGRSGNGYNTSSSMNIKSEIDKIEFKGNLSYREENNLKNIISAPIDKYNDLPEKEKGDKSLDKALMQGYADFLRANNDEADSILYTGAIEKMNFVDIKKDMEYVRDNGIAKEKGWNMREVARDIIWADANANGGSGNFKRGKDWKTP